MITIPGFELQEPLWRESTTAYFQAKSLATDQPVIVKAPLREGDIPTVRRLKREFHLGNRLKASEVIQFIDLIERPGRAAIVMEPMGARPLREMIPVGGVSLECGLNIACRLAAALAEIHKRELIHKAISPDVFLVAEACMTNPEADGPVALYNMASASALPFEHHHPTGPNHLEGDVHYLSPEQTGRMNRALDHRSDFYSLGVTLYELLTGKPPFSGKHALDVVNAHISRSPPPLRGDVPHNVARIIYKLLSKYAEDRYHTAEGLIADLQIMREPEKASTNFKPGALDRPKQPYISPRLYGRRTVCQEMMSAFDRADRGDLEIVRVSGAPGVGKTRLVGELHRTISKRSGYLISGKFDHYRRTAYHGLIQAFRDLIQQIVGEDQETVRAWREAILEALGPNGKVITQLIPEVADLIGYQPEIQELGPEESRNRFHLVFRAFLKVFAQEDHPLILFLDDLQWADSASLQTLDNLFHQDGVGHLLVIIAYRDGELHPSHPLQELIKGLASTDAGHTHIALEPLEKDRVEAMLFDTLYHSAISHLVDWCHKHTGGNPLFLRLLLQDLQQRNLFTWNEAMRCWTYHLDQRLQNAAIKDPVAFIARAITATSSDLVRVLRLAACIGNAFDLKTLSIITETKPQDVAREIWDAVGTGWITPLEDAYRAVIMETTDQDASTIHYKFQHDHVQEAAYSLIPPSQIGNTHLHIARLLEAHCHELEREDQILEIADHYSLGIDLVDDPDERRHIAEINLDAARKAKRANALKSALGYIETARSLLPQDSWSTHYQVTLDIHALQAELAYQNGVLDVAEQLLQTTFDQARSPLDRAKLLRMRADQYVALNRHRDAVNACLQGLDLLDVDINRRPNWLKVYRTARRARKLLSRQTLDALLERPSMDDALVITQMQLYTGMITPSYIIGDHGLFAMALLHRLILTLTHGNSPESAHAFAGYGLLLAVRRQDPYKGFQYGKLALKLNEHYSDLRYRARIAYMNAILYCWNQHWRDFVRLLENTLEASLQTGDLIYLGYAGYELTYWRQDDPLHQAVERGERLQIMINSTRNKGLAAAQRLLLQCLRSQAGQTKSRFLLREDDFDEAALFDIMRNSDFRPSVAVSLMVKIKLYLSYEAYARAFRLLGELDGLADVFQGRIFEIEYRVYGFITRAAIYPRLRGVVRRRTKALMRRDAKIMAAWARRHKGNFEHFHKLFQAEKAALAGKHFTAGLAFAKAAEAAHKENYPTYAALINERAAIFHHQHGDVKTATAYMREVYAWHEQRGAVAKLRFLEERYRRNLLQGLLIDRHLHRHPTHSGDGQTLSQDTLSKPVTTPSLQAVTPSSTGVSTTSHKPDLAMVTRAAQSISSEIDLDQLLRRILQVCQELSNARRVFLIMLEHDDPRVWAFTEQDLTLSLNKQPLADMERLPSSLIRYVIRTGDNLILNDAVNDSSFARMSDVMRCSPRSVLCMPVRRRDETVGVVYMDNVYAPGMFHVIHIQMLYIIIAQAAASLDNAVLYREALTSAVRAKELNAQLEQRVAQRTAQLEEFQAKLVQRAHQEGMANHAAQIFHDVGAIIAGIISSAKELHQAHDAELNTSLKKINHYLDHTKPDAAGFLGELADLETMTQTRRQTHQHHAKRLVERVTAVRDVVLSQQSHAAAGYQHDLVQIEDIVEEVISIEESRLQGQAIDIQRTYGETPRIFVQKIKLIHILINLIRNAADAMVDAPQKVIRITTRTHRKQLILSIADQGMGIAPEHMEKIFSHGFTTKSDSHGFGLHGCAISMTEMGGRMWVESDGLAQGAVFHLEFPAPNETGIQTNG